MADTSLLKSITSKLFSSKSLDSDSSSKSSGMSDNAKSLLTSVNSYVDASDYKWHSAGSADKSGPVF